MDNYLTDLIEKYRTTGLLIDSNLLLLQFIGSVSIQLLTSFKRTRNLFSEDDYLLLQLFIEPFKSVVTTPNILTEVYNLSNQLPEQLKPDYFSIFATQIALLDEIYTPSIDIVKMPEFLDYGLTDAGIYHTVKGKYMVLTDDFKLSQYLGWQGIDAINFNHLRTYL